MANVVFQEGRRARERDLEDDNVWRSIVTLLGISCLLFLSLLLPFLSLSSARATRWSYVSASSVVICGFSAISSASSMADSAISSSLGVIPFSIEMSPISLWTCSVLSDLVSLDLAMDLAPYSLTLRLLGFDLSTEPLLLNRTFPTFPGVFSWGRSSIPSSSFSSSLPWINFTSLTAPTVGVSASLSGVASTLSRPTRCPLCLAILSAFAKKIAAVCLDRAAGHGVSISSSPFRPLDDVNAENAMLKATPSANIYHCAGKLWTLEKASALILQICIDKAIPTQGVMVMPNSMYVQLPRVSTTAQAGF